MKTLNFEKRVEEVEISGKVYEIEVSNYNFIKEAQKNLVVFEQAQAKMQETGNVEDVLEAAKIMVNFILGDFDRLWRVMYEDIYNLMDLCVLLSGVVSEGMQYKARQYGV